jgi:glyoxylase-like metal-dependent hydrolase (beta-lactamase superfamily II)
MRFHRFAIGANPAVMLSDGPLRLARPHRIFQGPDREALADALRHAGLDPERIRVEQNCLLLDAGGRRMLFDNGMGADAMFGPDAGKLLDSMRAAGIDPASVDALVLTHAHSDHCWGTMGADGTPAFPNAEIYMAQAEIEFWASPGQPGQDADTLAGVAKHLLPLRDRIVGLRDGQAFLPGVQAWLTPGHTPGHMAYLIDGGVCVTGDVAFHDPLSFLYPDARCAYDSAPESGVETRRRLLDRLASERLRIAGYHSPWPGLGRVERFGASYRYLAE